MPQGTGEVGKKQDILGIVPYVRIHDYVLSISDITSLELDCSEFLPTMALRVKTPSTTLSDTNKIDDGDLVSIGIKADMKVFKPIVVDFLVTSVQSSSQGLGQNEGDGLYEYYIKGRLNIPNIDTEDIRFSYQGYAEEALMEGAKRVGLGYVENDNPRTPSIKKETWTCYDNVLEFFQNVTKHMWAGKDSFFDSWIDLYMNLVNVNVNDILGRKIEDDGVMDFTKYRSIIASAGNDGKYVHNDLDSMDKYKDNKLFTNDKQAQTSVWFVNSYYLENNATKISKKYGIQKNFNIYIQNNGLGQAENDSKYEVGIGVYYNQEKLQLGYVILNGPAEADKNYKKADNGNWKNQNIRTEAPVIMPIQSDGDEDGRQNAKNNKKVSGNFSKEYLIAPEHNKINLAELEKQNVIIRTTGFNNGFARGEKVPCVLYRQSDTKYLNPVRELPDTTYLLDAICSGWFYVKAVKYIYTPKTNAGNTISDWVTETTLTRREWFPPEPTTTSAGAGDGGGNGGGNSSQSNTPSPTSIASGDTQLNDVTNGASNAATDNPTSNTKPEDSFPQNTNGTQTESSPMEKEVQQNIDSQERNTEALNALDANDKTAEVLDNTEKTTDKVNDANDKTVEVLNNAEKTTDKVNDAVEDNQHRQIKTSEVKDKISGVIDAVSQGISALSGVQKVKDTITNTILSGGTVSSSAISALNSGTESALTSALSAVSNLNTSLSKVSEIGSNLNTALSKVSEIGSNLKNLNDSLNNVQSLMDIAKTLGSVIKKTDTSQTVKVVDEEDSEIYDQINITKEEGMAYDENGLKHIMNIWLSIMGSEGISFTTLGTRRWAVNNEDSKVYGNAFLQRQSSKTFKTLDSDGKLYWLSDYNSRHYYGEAVDITGDLQEILDAVAKSDNVLDCMHKFGICMQIETSESGQSKGTHFHCSTDPDNPQTKFWGVVNRIRETNKMPKYTVVVNSEFYELETKNPVELA